MIKSVRYFAFSLIDSQSADAFVSRQRMNNALAFELMPLQVARQAVDAEQDQATYIAAEGAGIAPIGQKDIDRAFELIANGDWLKVEILPTVYRRDVKYRHSARTHQWAPEYINPISFKAYIHRSGKLISHSRPRIARECLEPAGQGGIILGTIDELDTFYEENPYPDYEHPAQGESEERLSIEDTLAYCDRMLAEVCRGDLEQPLEGLRYQRLDNPILILKAEQDASIKPLLAVYDALETLNATAPCLERFVGPLEQRESPHPASDRDLARPGVQWGTLQPEVRLSDDQIRAVNASLTMKPGSVLAINGPPGTGKTAILKEIVATQVVRSVLGNQPAPLLAITSTNNQAIRNAMESLTRYTTGNQILHQRWINDVEGFAVYAVSQHGEALADEYNLFTLNRLDNLEQTLDLAQAAVQFCRRANEVLRPETPYSTIEDACSGLKRRLRSEAKTQAWATALPKQIMATKSENQFRKLLADFKQHKAAWLSRHALDHPFNQAWSKLETTLVEAAHYFEQIKRNQGTARQHLEVIQSTWQEHPILRRLGFGRYSGLLQPLARKAINEALVAQGLDPGYTTEAETKSHYQKLHKEYAATAREMFQRLAHSTDLSDWQTQAERDLAKHYRSDWFWLAIHVREGQWLMELRDTLRARDPDKRTQDKVTRRLNRHALITPVLVATLHRLPKVLSHWDIGQQCELPLFNILDTLIIDEAGQCSTDVAAASLALTQRAICFGDRGQLEPVHSVSEREDIGNRIASGLLTKEQARGFENERFNACGGSTSGGSALWLAQKSTCFTNSDGRDPGLWLTVNRRSVPDILELSNQLCYEGTLVSGRDNTTASPFPSVAVMEIPGRCQEKLGSRLNQMEGMSIVTWLAHEKNAIEQAYGKPLKECVGVITPFKAQADFLQARMDRQLGKDQAVTVGTIHSLQGAERPIIVLSLTYSAEGHPQSLFFDQSPTMLNVAASRAQDSLIVMGDLDVLARAQNCAKLLAEYLQERAIPLRWAPWHADMGNQVGAVWGRSANAALVPAPDGHALLMALGDDTITEVTITASQVECAPLQTLGNEMIKASQRGCKITLIVGQKSTLSHPESARIGRGFDALQNNGVSIRYSANVLSNRVCLSNNMTLITPTSWFGATNPEQILLVQDDQGSELRRLRAAYNLP